MYDEVRKTDPGDRRTSSTSNWPGSANQLEMIASENFTSRAVMETMGSTPDQQVCRGVPQASGTTGAACTWTTAETLAKKRAMALFGAERANVQPHSGSTANMTAYLAFLKPGDKIHRACPCPTAGT